MSGKSAMAISLVPSAGCGWDSGLYDACLAFSETLVRNAAAVIEGAKPAAIFSLPMRAFAGGQWRQLSRSALDEALRAYARALPGYGVRLGVLWRNARRVFLLVWRPQLLMGVLASADSVDILREQGYRGSGESELVRELRQRLSEHYRASESGSKGGFPHEIGVFLGYPACDVRGFMAGEQPVCVGAWKAYGDERAAKRSFERLKRHERRCRSRFAAGEPLYALFA